jgi:hypothetical protein
MKHLCYCELSPAQFTLVTFPLSLHATDSRQVGTDYTRGRWQHKIGNDATNNHYDSSI